MNPTRSVSRGARTPLLLAGALLGAALLFAAPAQAAPEYQLGGFGGVHLWNPYNGLGRTDLTSLNQYNHGVEFGIRLDLGLHPRFMLEAELALMPTTATDDSTQVFAFGYRAHAIINILTGRVRPFLLLGGGGLTSSTSDPNVVRQATTGSLDVGAGLLCDVRSNWGLRLDARTVLVPGGASSPPLVPDGEILLGLYGRFGELKGGVQPPADDDKDGIANAQDQCPQVAGPKENKGCPLDSDGDGVPDEQDKCPYEKGTAEFKGCASIATLDSDGDGIPDAQDKCPDAAETKNGYLDYDGCPDTPPPAALLPFLGTVAGVAFESDRVDLTPASLPVLDRAVAALREHPTIKIEVAGYTDNSGDPVRNHELSQKRAEAVKAYLISKGIDAARLISTGFGQDNPLADNATPEGREKNRRVEFHFLN
jgi:outer membrane protein OmpA-like peptidoglycan-associated protein